MFQNGEMTFEVRRVENTWSGDLKFFENEKYQKYYKHSNAAANFPFNIDIVILYY